MKSLEEINVVPGMILVPRHVERSAARRFIFIISRLENEVRYLYVSGNEFHIALRGERAVFFSRNWVVISG